MRCRPRPARSVPTCSATCGRRNGATYTRSLPRRALANIGYDIGALLKSKGYDPIKMVKTGEAFFKSLGFAPLP
jgi:hypothetical protein